MADTQTNENTNGGNANTGTQSSQAGVPHDVLNADWIDDLALAGTVAKAAKVEGREAALEAEGVTRPYVDDVLLRIGLARTQVTVIQTARSNRTGATGNEGEALSALIKTAGPVQSAAKRKFARSQPTRLKLYAAGEGVDLYNMSRAQLLVAIPTLITTAIADGLSGANNAKTDAVQAAFEAWNNFDATQNTQNTAETAAREELKALLFGPDGKGETGIIADRRNLQYAADSAWPPGTNIAIRREFKLQEDRRFNG